MTRQNQGGASAWRQLRREIRDRFSLQEDKADDEEIERRIREGAQLNGATPWILMFAIFVASVGLNVNSTAVIIGAMLISPLMGPIMGVGLGVAVYDFELVKRCLVNLAVATAISLVVSALYFAVSPLRQAQSELLARTSPTLWDVLIALFGGMAGVIGMTRRERSNVIPGVAIATALMPPVCTAGFGLANGRWGFVAGALYLYAINCVFICLATIAGIRALRLKRHTFDDPGVARRVKATLVALSLCTALPSVYTATVLVRDEVYKSKARDFIHQQFSFAATRVADVSIDPRAQTIELALIGDPVTADMIKVIEGRLAASSLAGTRLVIRQSVGDKLDVSALKSTLLRDLYEESRDALEKKQAELDKLRQQLATRNALYDQARNIRTELMAQYPAITSVYVGDGLALNGNDQGNAFALLDVQSSRALDKADRARIQAYFGARTQSSRIKVDFELAPPAASGEKPARPLRRR